MMDMMQQGGYVMWLILAVGLLILGLASWSGFRTTRLTARHAVVEARIDAILFWGGWALVVGLLGTFVGIYQAAGVIEQAGGAGASLIWGGIKVSLTTTVFGLLVFSIAALLWIGLRTHYRRSVTAGAGAAGAPAAG